MEVFRPGAPSKPPPVNCPPVSILVLMEVFRPAVKSLNVPFPSIGFNPCSDGSVSTGARSSRPVSHLRRFNPCSDGSVSTGCPGRTRRRPLPSCFNPCSDGSVSTGQNGVLDKTAWAYRVSILVLMEVFRPGRMAPNTAVWWQSFNPCSDGSVSTGPRRKRSPKTR